MFAPHARVRLSPLPIVAALLLPTLVLAQAKSAAKPPVRPAAPLAVAALAAPFDTLALGAVKWREIGPFRGGRSSAVAGSTARPKEYWMGTVGGGVFKTVDGGTSWQPMSDKYFGGTIGYIAVAPSNPDIVYVGGGEFPVRGHVHEIRIGRMHPHAGNLSRLGQP